MTTTSLRNARVRAAAARLMDQALDALASGVRPAAEAALRQVVGPITGGRHWDVRIASDQTVHLWDEERQAWTPLREVADDARGRLTLAVGVAFLSAVRPHDAPNAPAFLWLDAAGEGVDAGAIEALLDALMQTDIQRHFPQVIATAAPGGLRHAGFDHVANIVEGASEPSSAQAAPARWLKAVG